MPVLGVLLPRVGEVWLVGWVTGGCPLIGCMGGCCAINDWPDFDCSIANNLGIPSSAATTTIITPRMSGTAAKGELVFLVVVPVVSVLSGKSFTNLATAVGLAEGFTLTLGEGEVLSFTVTTGEGVVVALLVLTRCVGATVGLVVGRRVGCTVKLSPPTPVVF